MRTLQLPYFDFRNYLELPSPALSLFSPKRVDSRTLFIRLSIIMLYLCVGFIVDLISAPVISGFCSAAALTAIATQMKGLLGLKFQGSSFLTVWRGVFENLSDINYYDAGLGFLTIFSLLIMRVSVLESFPGGKMQIAFTPTQ